MTTRVSFAPTKSAKTLQSVRGTRVYRVLDVPPNTSTVDYTCLANSELQLLEDGKIVGQAKLSINIPRELILKSPAPVAPTDRTERLRQAEIEGRKVIQGVKAKADLKAKAKAKAEAARAAQDKLKADIAAKEAADKKAKAKADTAKAAADLKAKEDAAKAAQVKEETNVQPAVTNVPETGSGFSSDKSDDV